MGANGGVRASCICSCGLVLVPVCGRGDRGSARTEVELHLGHGVVVRLTADGDGVLVPTDGSDRIFDVIGISHGPSLGKAQPDFLCVLIGGAPDPDPASGIGHGDDEGVRLALLKSFIVVIDGELNVPILDNIKSI